MDQIELEIVSPEKLVAKEEGVLEIILPAFWGQMDVLPGYADFMTTLRQGEIVFRKGAQSQTINITGGLFTISNNKATILVDGLMATVTSIDDARQKKAS